jgi:riboflavin synthase
MFTGIIEEIGEVFQIQQGAKSLKIKIKASKVLADVSVGDSIAVNGICLTVCEFNDNTFSADVMAETIRKSSMSGLKMGSRVNLERAMSANGRFGGHIVSGHIDGIGKIENIKPEDNAIWFTISTTNDLSKYIVKKGSIAIDGISLTVAEVKGDIFKVSIIPHTAKETILSIKKSGDVVNLECDIVGKYIEKLINRGETSSITKDFLALHGY